MKDNEIRGLKKKARKISILEGSGQSFMNGFGTRFITPFAVSIGTSNQIIAWLGTFPSLLSNFFQVSFHKNLSKVSRKKLICNTVLIQASLWIPLILLAYFYFTGYLSSISASLLLLLFYTLMIVSGEVGNSFWKSWMRDLLPEKGAAYLGKRNFIVGIVSLLGLFFAGLILDFLKETNIFLGFLILFGIAFLGRFFSYLMLRLQYEPEYTYVPEKYFSFFEFLKKMKNNNFGRFVIFTSLLSFAITFASPFFGVYMLRELGFQYNYLFYTLAIMGFSLSSLLSMTLWGGFIDNYGSKIVMNFTGIFVAAMPLLWIISYPFYIHSFYLAFIFIFFLELLSGFIFAGYNMAKSMFVYHAVTRERLSLCLSYGGFLAAISGFLGATIGGIVSNFSFFGINSFLGVFFISFILRSIVVLYGANFVNEVKESKPFKIEGAILSTLSKLNFLPFLFKRKKQITIEK
jgi:MFS family permease